MKHVDDYRDAKTCRRLVREIHRRCTQRYTLMEVCGGQTHALVRHGIEQALQGAVELIHGPGCPVCVTPVEDIELAIAISRRPDCLVASFGDMLRVPGNHESLRDAAASGGNVRMVYSPLDAVRLAQENPTLQVIFFAVGFETTAPATALAVWQAQELKLTNFSLLVSHVRVQPAMEMIMRQPTRRVQGFLAAGHVCAVSGYESYRSFVDRFGVPVVIAGFEPVDLLAAILACVEQLEAGLPRVTNLYQRTVLPSGNAAAMNIVDQVYQVCDRSWRGLGMIPEGGFQLRPVLDSWDARSRFQLPTATGSGETLCPSGAVLLGQLRPQDCPYFGNRCTPVHPLGAPMVSSEGACAAYYQAK